MSRTYSLPLGGTALSVSRSSYNDALDALRSTFSGAGNLSSSVANQIYVDTTAGELRMRNTSDSGNISIGVLDSANLGLLLRSGGTMTGNLLVNGADNLILDLGRAGDTVNARIDFDDDGDTSLRASADDTLTVEVAAADQVQFTSGKLDLALTSGYVLSLGRTGDSGNARIDLDFDGDTSIVASADDTINIEVGADADFIVINANGIKCDGELRVAGDNGGASGFTTFTGATIALGTTTAATLGNVPDSYANGAQDLWLKFRVGTTETIVAAWQNV